MVYRLGQRRRRYTAVRVLLCLAVVVFMTGSAAGVAKALMNGKIDIAKVVKGVKGTNKKAKTGSKTAKNSESKQVTPVKTKTASKPASTTSPSTNSSAASCIGGVSRNLSESSNGQLRRLAVYEEQCQAVSGMSFFINTPSSTTEADNMASWVAQSLESFSASGIKPIIFVEPVTASGGLISAEGYRSGSHDAALEALFSGLKSRGISDTQMGVWVFWPEANIPVWSSVDPSLFSANVTRSAQIQKKHFPSSHVSVMLDSKSYPSASSWEGGAYRSLTPYVSQIPAGLIDSFGLQGFAWPPTYPGDEVQLDANTFLPTSMAIEAAQSLDVSNIWLNTGVFVRSGIINRDAPYALSSETRRQVLDAIVRQSEKLKTAGFNTTVHLFAEDKFSVGEAIDWSYDSDMGLYKYFVSELKARNVTIWIYDRAR